MIHDKILMETRHYLNKYDCWEDEIEDFLINRGTFIERQEKAIDIIKNIMTVHGKKELYQSVSELARVEHGIRELQPWVRDHVVHSLLGFILGIYINEKLLRQQSASVNKFQWKLAGLFHDVGYPIEIANNIMKPFTDKINDIKKKFGVNRPDIVPKIALKGIENLQNNVNSFDLIQERLKEWDIRVDIKKEYDRIVNSGKIDHGIIGSLSVLYVIDMMYETYNQKRYHKRTLAPGTNIDFDQTYFERDVVSACSAISIHNLPAKCFAKSKIDRTKAPVAFLLKLSDCLQEWERPSKTNLEGVSATKFHINIDSNKLLFQADIADGIKKNIKDKITSSLVAPDVEIH